MTATAEAARARRYLLGDASDEECAVIEREYLQHEEAVDRIAAAEDDLIEDYLAGQLSPSDRDRFERAYLSVPDHRVRVDTIRRLMAHTARGDGAHREQRSLLSWMRAKNHGPLLALAASLLVVASVTLWRLSHLAGPPGQMAHTPPPPSAAAPREQPPTPPANVPRLFAVTISPASVRSGEDNPAVVVPADTDTVVIRFEADVDSRKLVPRRASIQTVGGAESWQGPITTENDPPPGTVARIDVPATSLPGDDYLVTLYGTDQAGVEREWTRYFLRVRVRRE